LDSIERDETVERDRGDGRRVGRRDERSVIPFVFFGGHFKRAW